MGGSKDRLSHEHSYHKITIKNQLTVVQNLQLNNKINRHQSDFLKNDSIYLYITVHNMFRLHPFNKSPIVHYNDMSVR